MLELPIKQRVTDAKSLSDWIGVDEATMMRTSLERIYWATMTANARERHGTYEKKKVAGLATLSSLFLSSLSSHV